MNGDANDRIANGENLSAVGGRSRLRRQRLIEDAVSTCAVSNAELANYLRLRLSLDNIAVDIRQIPLTPQLARIVIRRRITRSHNDWICLASFAIPVTHSWKEAGDEAVRMIGVDFKPAPVCDLAQAENRTTRYLAEQSIVASHPKADGLVAYNRADASYSVRLPMRLNDPRPPIFTELTDPLRQASDPTAPRKPSKSSDLAAPYTTGSLEQLAAMADKIATLERENCMLKDSAWDNVRRARRAEQDLLKTISHIASMNAAARDLDYDFVTDAITGTVIMHKRQAQPIREAEKIIRPTHPVIRAIGRTTTASPQMGTPGYRSVI